MGWVAESVQQEMKTTPFLEDLEIQEFGAGFTELSASKGAGSQP